MTTETMSSCEADVLGILRKHELLPPSIRDSIIKFIRYPDLGGVYLFWRGEEVIGYAAVAHEFNFQMRDPVMRIVSLFCKDEKILVLDLLTLLCGDFSQNFMGRVLLVSPAFVQAGYLLQLALYRREHHGMCIVHPFTDLRLG